MKNAVKKQRPGLLRALILIPSILMMLLLFSCDDTAPCYGKIRFDANGGTGSMQDQTVSSGQTELLNCGFARDDYFFTGWNTSADGCGTAYL